MTKRERISLAIAEAISWTLNPISYIIGYVVTELKHSYNGGKFINKIENGVR